MARYIGLIRAIVPKTHAIMPMAKLREACVAAGFSDVSTILATGNVLFAAGGRRVEVLKTLQAIIASFGLDNAVVIRTPAEIEAVIAANPLHDAAEAHPSAFAVFFLAGPPRDTSWFTTHPGPERLAQVGLEVFVDYPQNISTSKLPPAKIERLLGTTTTFRNWNTVKKLVKNRPDRS